MGVTRKLGPRDPAVLAIVEAAEVLYQAGEYTDGASLHQRMTAAGIPVTRDQCDEASRWLPFNAAPRPRAKAATR